MSRNTTYMIFSLVVAGLAMAIFAATPHVPSAPTVPMTSSSHEGTQNATTHWRLVAETDQDGRPVRRVPITKVHYRNPNECAEDGSKAAGPPPAHDNIDYLIRCLPYHDEDTDTETPIN